MKIISILAALLIASIVASSESVSWFQVAGVAAAYMACAASGLYIKHLKSKLAQ